MIAAMEFVTLTTGSTTIARRADITNETMALTRDLLAEAPHPSGWGVQVTATHPTSHAYSVKMHGEETSYCLLCTHADAHEVLWQIAEGLAPPQVVLHRPRGVPWLAVAIGPAILRLTQEQQLALSWLEAAVAWRLISAGTQ